MPTNRHALIRYQTIDRCLQQHYKKWTAKSLAEACAEALKGHYEKVEPPSRSTISRDLRFMRSAPPAGFDAPIAWDDQRCTYYYSEPGFSISNTPLSEDALKALGQALHILRQTQYFRQMEGLEPLTAGLAQMVKLKRREARPILAFSQPLETPAYRWLDFLYRATEQEWCLQLDYEPFQEPAFTAIISPYLLKEYNNRWFLIAYDHRLHLLRNHALDRIQNAEHYLLEAYYHAPQFNPHAYFNDIIGVTLPEGGRIEEILFRSSPLQARYIHTKPLHSSQQLVEETPDYLAFSLRLIPNYELESLLLSFGEHLQVLQPQWLAQRLKERLALAAAAYP